MTIQGKGYRRALGVAEQGFISVWKYPGLKDVLLWFIVHHMRISRTGSAFEKALKYTTEPKHENGGRVGEALIDE
jgi:hypothetical protein